MGFCFLSTSCKTGRNDFLKRNEFITREYQIFLLDYATFYGKIYMSYYVIMILPVFYPKAESE